MNTFSRHVTLGLVLTLVVTMALAGLLVTAPGARATHETVSWFNYGTVSAATGFDRNQPVAVSDRTSFVYFFYYTTRTASGTTNINVTKYSIGTNLLGLPTEVFDKQVNDVANVVDSSSPLSATIDHAGNLYVAWTRLPAGGLGLEVYVSKSSDGGVTWLPAVRGNAPNAYGDDVYPSIATAPDGTVYVAWMQAWGSFINITVSQSTNGGNTFISYTNASGQGKNGLALYPALGVDSGGRLYLAYLGLSPSPFSEQVNVTTSDGGVTWSEPRQLTPSSTIPYQPSLLVDSSGRVHLFWYDYRGLITTGQLTLWQSMSLDRGATWTAGSPISQGRAAPAGFPTVSSHLDEIMVAWSANTGGNHGMAYVVSADGGMAWTPELFFYPGYAIGGVGAAPDQNGTYYAGVTDTSTANNQVHMVIWNGPPSAPVITSVARGTTSLTVTWSASPEKDVASYGVYRSTDGVNFQLIATVSAPTATFDDTGLSNGTYWYEIDAVDNMGTPSHMSTPMSASVGPTVQEMIDALNAQIAALQAQLATVNSTTHGQITALQSQVTSLQAALTALQTSQTASNAATAAQLAQLQSNITKLQDQLNTLQGQQATQTISYANLAFEIIVVVLLVVVLLNQMRKPKTPQIMMAQPGQVAPPPKPEDDL